MFLKSIWVWVSTVLYPPEIIPAPANNTIRVIGVGLSRTGTLSTRLALSRLLGGKIYHGYESDMDDRADFWLRAAENPDCVSADDWREFLSGRGYTAGVGEPMALFFKEIAKVYPEAKFLLNTRDPHDWYKSMKMAIIKPRTYLERPPISWIFSFFSIEQNKQLFHKVRSLTAARLGLNHSSWTAVTAGEAEAVTFFNSWHQLVVNNVPEDKLLIYNVKEGWAPLASLLDMEAPDEPFPDINDGITVTLIVLGGYYILVLVIPLLIFICLWKKSSKFRNILQRMFGFCLGAPLAKLRSFRRSHVMNNNSNVKNNNVQSSDKKKFSYVKYSNIEV